MMDHLEKWVNLIAFFIDHSLFPSFCSICSIWAYVSIWIRLSFSHFAGYQLGADIERKQWSSEQVALSLENKLTSLEAKIDQILSKNDQASSSTNMPDEQSNEKVEQNRNQAGWDHGR